MPDTTTAVGRQQVVHPDLGYSGGATLHGLVRDIYTFFSNQVNIYWSGSITLANTGTIAIIHNLGTSLTNLKLVVVESGAIISEASKAASYTITQLSINQIQVQNISGGSKTFEVYFSQKLGIVSSDFDPAVSLSTTGNVTAQNITANGNLVVQGDLTVNGTTTTINATNLEVADKNINLNNGGTNASAEGSGITVEGTGNSTVAKIIYDSSLSSGWRLGDTVGTEIGTRANTMEFINKDFNGGTASDTSRITFPKAGTTALNALTRKQGTVWYDTDLNVLKYDTGSTLIAFSGDVQGPASSTDNTLVRFDGTSGKLIQGSNITISDAHEMHVPAETGTTAALRVGTSTQTAAGTIGQFTVVNNASQYSAIIENKNITAGANYGLIIKAGSNASDFIVNLLDKNGTQRFYVNGAGDFYNAGEGLFAAATGTRRYLDVGTATTTKFGSSGSDISVVRVSSNGQSFVEFEDRSQSADSRRMAIRFSSQQMQFLARANDAGNSVTVAGYINNTSGGTAGAWEIQPASGLTSGTLMVWGASSPNNTMMRLRNSGGSSDLMNFTHPANGYSNAWNGAAACFYIAKDATTNRSINAAGTVNASGADYAEYMVKATDFALEKGAVCGVDANGKLTDKWSLAHHFMVKSTDPALVGGDKWFVKQIPQDIDFQEGVDEEYEETDDKGKKKKKVRKVKKLKKQAFEEAKAKHLSDEQAARVMVDRIAFCGQVPVNVYGAQVGDYIVPVESLNDTISAVSVASPTFEQYQKAVGKVIAIEEDARARIIVKSI